MVRVNSVAAVILFSLILLIGREGQAVIYKYVDVKGLPAFTDDLQNIPEQYRSQAVIVSGGNDYDAFTEQEKARSAAEERTRQEQLAQAASSGKAEETFSRRLIRSGIAIGLFAALLFVTANIHGLKEQAQVLLRIRATLALLLVAFLGYTHAMDVAGLFGKAGDMVMEPVTRAQEESAARGRKAAEAYKVINKIREQGELPEDARPQELDKK